VLSKEYEEDFCSPPLPTAILLYENGITNKDIEFQRICKYIISNSS